MKLNSSFFKDPLESGLVRRYILTKLTGKNIPSDFSEYDGTDFPLLEMYSSGDMFSNHSNTNILKYNGFTFIIDRDKVKSQLLSYSQLNRDQIINGILTK